MNRMNLKQKLLGAAAVFVMLSVTDANAQQSSALAVQAEVPAACVIDSAPIIPMDFGVLNVVAGGDTLRQSDFDWRCSQGTSVIIELSLGLGGGANLTQRIMTGLLGDTLPYRLEKSDGSDWGDTASGSEFTTTAAGFAATETTTIFGIITFADSQTAQVDVYQDTVTITLLP